MRDAVLTRGSRWKGRLLVLSGVALGVIVALGGTGWYFSDVLKDSALTVDHSPREPNLEVVAISDDQVTLRITPRAKSDGPWTKEGIWGVVGDGGYGQVGPILSRDDEQVVRRFVSLTGNLRNGDRVRLDNFAFPVDPVVAFDIPFQEVAFSSGLGEFPAWLIDGPSSTWAIMVHGRGADRREALRLLPTIVELGMPALIITYRNDEGVPASRDGFYQFGETEWEELEAAANYALDHGAQDLVLVGYSMGGAIVTNFLYQSPLAQRVRGAILEAPVLSFEALVDFRARRRGIPRPITAMGKIVANFRFDLHFGRRDYLSRADQLEVPILLFHGDDDETAPIETSDELARLRPDIVTYVRVPDATHVHAWNMDPDAYEGAVREFLRRAA